MIDINNTCPSCGGNEFKSAYSETNSVLSPKTKEKGIFKGVVISSPIGMFQYKICINCSEVVSTKLLLNHKKNFNDLIDE